MDVVLLSFQVLLTVSSLTPIKRMGILASLIGLDSQLAASASEDLGISTMLSCFWPGMDPLGPVLLSILMAAMIPALVIVVPLLAYRGGELCTCFRILRPAKIHGRDRMSVLVAGLYKSLLFAFSGLISGFA